MPEQTPPLLARLLALAPRVFPSVAVADEWEKLIRDIKEAGK